MTHTKLSEIILDAKRIIGGPPSDHDPIILHLQFSRKKTNDAPPKTQKPRIAWDKLDGPKKATKFKEIETKKIKHNVEKGAVSYTKMTLPKNR